MHTVKRSVLVPHSPAQMFDLVADVEKYPDFMPWCGGSTVQERNDQGMQASIVISIAGIRQTFTTRNTHYYPDRIEIELADGPLSTVKEVWHFQAAGADACQVLLSFNYAVSRRTL